MELGVAGHVAARNSIGQFISACERAATETVQQLIEDGKQLSLDMAPVGHKQDPRTPTLQEGMFAEMLSRTQGRWGCAARHALPIEFGAAPHPIHGNPFLYFFWESEGRDWIPGLLGPFDVVNHPGNAAQPFLRPAFAAIKNEASRVMAAKYPG